jgi:hypothetical protein
VVWAGGEAIRAMVADPGGRGTALPLSHAMLYLVTAGANL